LKATFLPGEDKRDEDGYFKLSRYLTISSNSEAVIFSGGITGGNPFTTSVPGSRIDFLI
jgi:hypothetical protein